MLATRYNKLGKDFGINFKIMLKGFDEQRLPRTLDTYKRLSKNTKGEQRTANRQRVVISNRINKDFIDAFFEQNKIK